MSLPTAVTCMLKYKNIDLAPDLAGLIRHMNSVEEYREVLQGLQSVWDNLTLLGQMSGTGIDMSGTRQSFNQLTSSLLNQLGGEILKKTVLELGSKAQVAVDILVRNLYERTADIGFLSTDEDIRAFLAMALDGHPDVDETADLIALRARLVARFAEYVAKYSVYSDIILLDTAGRVMARLDPDVNVPVSHASLLKTAMETDAAYVETFGAIDLLPDDPRAMVYSFRVSAPDGKVLGVLCLCFRFANEMERIFANLASPDDWSVVTLLDAAGRVIASSDPFHIPLGASLTRSDDASYRIIRFAGQEYLASTRPSKGYQGYGGPGWSGHVLLPIQHAFNKDASTLLGHLSREVLEAVTTSPSLFGEALRSIPRQAERIQRDLNRSVWNGNARQSGNAVEANAGFSKILLREISNTGARTKDVFERSIDNLHQTVVSAMLQDSRFQAALAIDIMDRNLYERANDCRWWALTSAFRSLLEAPAAAHEAADTIAGVLAYINSLYTVYSNLIVFDRDGRVVAVSNPAERALVGQRLTEEWCHRTLALGDSQDYVVSGFVPTALYGGRHTYVYGAAIRSLSGERVVGGVGIVFDSEPQFAAMLSDALPRNEAHCIQPGALGVFVDADGRVIACSDARIAVGAQIDIDTERFDNAPGTGCATVVALERQYYALGAWSSAGYREYKGEGDPYSSRVHALILVPLCETLVERARPEVPAPAIALDRGADSVEVATFLIGNEWYGVRAAQVLEAVDAAGLTVVPGAGADLAGYLRYDGCPIPVFQVQHILQKDAVAPGPTNLQQVIILQRNETSRFGLLVDALGDIPEVHRDRLSELPGMLAGGCVLADSILPVADRETERMLLILGVERIHARLAPGVTEPLLKVAHSSRVDLLAS